MAISQKITTESDITLIVLQNCPPALSFVSGVFQRIGQFGVDVDMIALTPSQGSNTSISFTISDLDLDKILSFTAEIRDTYKVKAIVSSGNCKISVYDPNMVNAPGLAAQVFSAASRANADIRIITTSEVDISMLVTSADYPEVLKSMQDEFGIS